MKVLVFLNSLSLGGTEKAAIRWATGLKARRCSIHVISLEDGPRRNQLEEQGIPLRVVSNETALTEAIKAFSPDIIHAHAPGFPHRGDILGNGIVRLPKVVPVVQTNIFGRLNNPQENAWTNFRMFISWTSCVQAARRSFLRLDESFFRRASVAVYPLDPVTPPDRARVTAFRQQLDIRPDEILFGRFSRPEPNKWTSLALDAFRLALKQNRNIKLLLREPPPKVSEALRASPDADRFVILPATADSKELELTVAATDVVLHTSSIGESFGYGIAEPMNLGKPVITHSVPWEDQAQIELVRHGECGFIASTPKTMAEAISLLALDSNLRRQMGIFAQKHIRALADVETSIERLEQVFQAVLIGKQNPFLEEDLTRARKTAAYLDQNQFGDTLGEQIALRPFHYRVRFYMWRQEMRKRFSRYERPAKCSLP